MFEFLALFIITAGFLMALCIYLVDRCETPFWRVLSGTYLMIIAGICFLVITFSIVHGLMEGLKVYEKYRESTDSVRSVCSSVCIE